MQPIFTLLKNIMTMTVLSALLIACNHAEATDGLSTDAQKAGYKLATEKDIAEGNSQVIFFNAQNLASQFGSAECEHPQLGIGEKIIESNNIDNHSGHHDHDHDHDHLVETPIEFVHCYFTIKK
ncbi:MAG: hypothetical protein CBC90_06210 [Acidimicrobiaceae bacterium TMED130]|nr:MAG: hypothetical protein CBC90_06210 [Acidimicrobiaceae bacterium TMED130]|tara:strand:- start:19418 stop:19789 length:372 start_codon:yes stop_codon:yes gene_type:complete